MSREYCDYVIDMLAPWDEVRARSMFGGFGIYCRDTFFALVADDTLYFKVDAETRGDYEQAGSLPFVYDASGKTATMSYWQVPAEVLDDPDVLARWADKALAVALRSKRKPLRKGPT